MNKKLRVYPYKQGSKSAKALADALGCKVLKIEGSTWRHAPDRTIINWGSSRPLITTCRVINNPSLVAVVSNKLAFFQSVAQIETEENKPRLVPWTSNLEEAKQFFEGKKKPPTVMCRTKLSSHSGDGIVIAQSVEELIECGLYTFYVPKDFEFRVHIMKGEVLDVQRKIRDPDKTPTSWKIRSHDNGFIYVRSGFETPADVIEQAQRAIRSSGLDFGAVDIIYSNKKQEAYVLEINTACGLEGTTVTKYAEAIRKLL